jgi:2-amino-4-hydroxy-6-hydroxymethyldihydropteridine diphosphokinase
MQGESTEVDVADRRIRAYIGLGANVGDAAATLASGIEGLTTLPGTQLRAVSRLYATRPVGVADQPEFRNAVAALDIRVPTGRPPADAALDLLVALKASERDAGRRPRGRWGPRELDLDILVFGRAAISVRRPPAGRSLDPVRAASPDADLLRIPHPEAHLRSFVLEPLADLAPALVPPGWGETVATAARRRRRVEGEDAVRPIAEWDAARGQWRPLGPPTSATTRSGRTG